MLKPVGRKKQENTGKIKRKESQLLMIQLKLNDNEILPDGSLSIIILVIYIWIYSTMKSFCTLRPTDHFAKDQSPTTAKTKLLSSQDVYLYNITELPIFSNSHPTQPTIKCQHTVRNHAKVNVDTLNPNFCSDVHTHKLMWSCNINMSIYWCNFPSKLIRFWPMSPRQCLMLCPNYHTMISNDTLKFLIRLY
jgi:hypothetical protein